MSQRWHRESTHAKAPRLKDSGEDVNKGLGEGLGEALGQGLGEGLARLLLVVVSVTIIKDNSFLVGIFLRCFSGFEELAIAHLVATMHSILR